MCEYVSRCVCERKRERLQRQRSRKLRNGERKVSECEIGSEGRGGRKKDEGKMLVRDESGE